jgi:hypothetical protein
MRSIALLAGILGGVANVLVDIDHLPYGLYDIQAPVYFNVFGNSMGEGRFLHPAFFFIGLLGIACSGGLLVLVFLRMARSMPIDGAGR